MLDGSQVISRWGLPMALNWGKEEMVRQRITETYGKESADGAFEEVIPSPQVEVMFPHPAGKVHDAGAVAEEEKKQEKGKRSKS